MTVYCDTIDHATLSRLVAAKGVSRASVVGLPDGWGIVIQDGASERALAAKRGSMRIFRQFETLVGYLKGIGLVQYQVDAQHFDPVTYKLSRRNASAAARLKATHDAAAHDKWFNEQVTEAQLEADEPNTIWLAHEAVKHDIAAQREVLKRSIAA